MQAPNEGSSTTPLEDQALANPPTQQREGGKRPRRPAGNIKVWRRANGDVGYALRFTDQYGDQQHLRCGLESEGWSLRLAEIQLEDTLDEVSRGTFRPPTDYLLDSEDADPLFEDFARATISEHGLGVRASTERHYANLLENHLLPAFGNFRLSEISYDRVREYRTDRVLRMEQIRRYEERGTPIRQANGARMSLSPKTINQTLWLLGFILEEAVRKESIAITANPARNKRLRIKVPKRTVRDHLERDEVQLLLEAAERVDNPVRPRTMRRAQEVRRLRDEEGLSMRETAKRLGIAESTGYILYYQHPPAVISQARTMMALLVGSGARNSEVCALRPIDIDFIHGKIRVREAKTNKGVREIDMTERVREDLKAWVAELGPGYDSQAPLFRGRRGNPFDKDVLNGLVKRIQAEMQMMCIERGLPPIPTRLTAHVFRRTYITHMFEAGAPPRYVQAQVGHEDSRTTIGIYSRVLDTRDRAQVGQAFDALLWDSKEPPVSEETDEGEEPPMLQSAA